MFNFLQILNILGMKKIIMHTARSGSLLMSLRIQPVLQDCKKQKQEEPTEKGEKQGALLEERMEDYWDSDCSSTNI